MELSFIRGRNHLILESEKNMGIARRGYTIRAEISITQNIGKISEKMARHTQYQCQINIFGK
jgi:hypothetical protein